jgi:hypothetical protein
MTIEKFAFPSASDVQCRDRRRLDPSMRIVPGTDWAALQYETKSPRPAPGALPYTSGATCLSSVSSNSGSIPADTEAGSATWAAGRTAAKDVAGGDKLDPKRSIAFVVRGGTGLSKCIEAALFRTRRCGGESGQLEHYPRPLIQFRHAEGKGGPFGGYLVLGARLYVGCTGDRKFLAVAAENS